MISMVKDWILETDFVPISHLGLKNVQLLVRQKDIEKRSELSQLIGALTSVQGRRKSNLINWLKTVPLSKEKRYIPCQMFKIEKADLWTNMLTYEKSLTEYLEQLGFDLDLESCQGEVCIVLSKNIKFS